MKVPLTLLPCFSDQAKADNKKAATAASSLPPVSAPAPIPAPPKSVVLTPNRNIANGVGLSTPAPTPSPISLTKRFDEDSSAPSSPVSSPVLTAAPLAAVKVAAPKVEVAAEAPKDDKEDGEITFEEAVKRRELKELEAATLMCSLENKEACLMCSG